MFGHLPELFIILVIALIVFGPEKLPEMAQSAGRMVREFRQALDSVAHPQDTEVSDDFSSYYYDSLARSGEEVPVDNEEDLAWHGVDHDTVPYASEDELHSDESDVKTHVEASSSPSGASSPGWGPAEREKG